MIGGIRLQGKKQASLLSWTIHRPFPPANIYIPLNQHEGLPAIPCVEAGDRVLIGQKIAEPQGFFSIAMHASVSGKVTGIETYPHPVLGETEAIKIHTDGADEKCPEIGHERHGWHDLSAEELYEIFRESGLVDFGKKTVPLHVKAAKPLGVKIKALIMNGCESDPYVTSDYALMMSHGLEILKGAEILRGLLDADKLVFTLDETQREVAELLKSKIYFLKWPHAEVRLLSSLYPQDADVSLAHDIFGVERTLILSDRETGPRIFNVATAFSVYEAIALQKPLYERVVTVGGECVVEPRNIWAKIGSSFEDAVKSCRGLMREPTRVLMNGPMTGEAQESLFVPVIKGTAAVLALPKEVLSFDEVQPCIRCNRCVDACPSEISPVMITLAAEQDLFDTAQKWGAAFCMECGNCAYVCPSKRPMMELIQHTRSHLQSARNRPSPGTGPSDITIFRDLSLNKERRPEAWRKGTQENKDLAETKVNVRK